MGILLAFHTLATVLLVGGLFFTLLILRPSTLSLEPTVRLTLWRDVLSRFFLRAWIGIAVLLVTGLAMMRLAFGSLVATAPYVRAMLALGVLLAIVFAYVHFVPWQHFKRAALAAEWPLAETHVSHVRLLLTIILALGVVTVVIGSGGRYFH
jgi:uncharacterized membrane protein